jgi:prolyl-tRNA editing enzyme YbaK/EbsC (Cys-tRNA(Pro) deacylase)
MESISENEITFNKVKQVLDSKNIEYTLMEHLPTKTSEESATIRNTSIESGAKAMLIKIDTGICMIVISAALKFNNKAAKKFLKTRNLRFINADELSELTVIYINIEWLCYWCCSTIW